MKSTKHLLIICFLATFLLSVQNKEISLGEKLEKIETLKEKTLKIKE